MADLPQISQNLDDPLPQVDPNSQLVPYRMSRTDPGGQPVVTTGYGPRGRPPIQPPQGFGGGVGMPSLDQVYQSAFSQLPVDEAVKAVEAATRYVAQRGYQKDIQGGADPIKTFAKYAPLMFKQATGLPEVFQAQMQQQKLNAPTIHGAGGGLYRVPAAGPAETLVAPKPVAPKLHFNASTGEVVQENPDGTLKQVREGTPKPVETPEVKTPLSRVCKNTDPLGLRQWTTSSTAHAIANLRNNTNRATGAKRLKPSATCLNQVTNPHQIH